MTPIVSRTGILQRFFTNSVFGFCIRMISIMTWPISHWAISHCQCAWVQTMELMGDNDGVKLIYKKAFWINKPLRQNAKFLIWQTRCQILTFWDNRYILSNCTERVHSCKSEMIEIKSSDFIGWILSVCYILHILCICYILEYLFKPTESFKSPYKTAKTFKIPITCNHAFSTNIAYCI